MNTNGNGLNGTRGIGPEIHIAMQTFDVNRFKQLTGLALGRYVDEIERSGIDCIHEDVIADLLTQEQSLSLDHMIYLARWGAQKNLKEVTGVILRMMKDHADKPGLQITLVKTLRLMSGVNSAAFKSLERMPTRVPDYYWKEYLQTFRIIEGHKNSN